MKKTLINKGFKVVQNVTFDFPRSKKGNVLFSSYNFKKEEQKC